ncbi:hypothetical protein QLQ85_10905 [Halomonas sp. M4R5S39]|uniref:hypothetical protein n=1 Tax=Halomonas kalidii TaxID=3043293 RepID=UPI0024A97BA7|nr:hypothetical protein [Halomonas kalidii]MDI5985302.1 hypothetical protein [Halomonas kalidii]
MSKKVELVQGFGLESTKRFFYMLLVESWLAKLLGSPVLSIVVPILVGLYYIVLDVWGDDWSIIVDFKSFHEIAFSLLAGATVFVAFWRGVSESLKSKVDNQSLVMQKSIALYCNELVHNKAQTVLHRAKSLKPNANPFRRVVLPQSQIRRSIEGIHKLLSDAFRIERRNIRITIISRRPTGGKWHYEFKHKVQREHHPADKIMNGCSAASHCYSTGESLFIADIRKGIKESVFMHSERSQGAEIGSLFCKPVKIVVNSCQFDYIFTIAIYGELLCPPYKKDECSAWANIFDDIADRIELELYLLSVDKYSSSGGKMS